MYTDVMSIQILLSCLQKIRGLFRDFPGLRNVFPGLCRSPDKQQLLTHTQCGSTIYCGTFNTSCKETVQLAT